MRVSLIGLALLFLLLAALSQNVVLGGISGVVLLVVLIVVLTEVV